MAKEQTFKVGDLVKSNTKNDGRILTLIDARYLVTPDGEGWEYTVEDSEGNTVRVREFGEDNLVLLHREPEAQTATNVAPEQTNPVIRPKRKRKH